MNKVNNQLFDEIIELLNDYSDYREGFNSDEKTIDRLMDAINLKIKEDVEAEREGCAKLCDHLSLDGVPGYELSGIIRSGHTVETWTKNVQQ